LLSADNYITDLSLKFAPQVKLGFSHFMFFNKVVLLVLGDDTSMNCAA
jgi:hypothetical protein